MPIFKIFVGWCPKKVPKVPAFFGLGGTLIRTYQDVQNPGTPQWNVAEHQYHY